MDSLKDILNKLLNSSVNINLSNLEIDKFLFLLILSLLSSFIISFLYIIFYKNRSTGSRIYMAFPLLGISITAIFICIQFSLPLSLGLLGSLSIVRFRTPIKEPEEIGFLMLLISSSIACATFSLYFLAIILLVGLLGLVMIRYAPNLFKGVNNDGIIVIHLTQKQYEKSFMSLSELLKKRFKYGKVDSITNQESFVVVSFSFVLQKNDNIILIQNDVKSILPDCQMNVFFNRVVI